MSIHENAPAYFGRYQVLEELGAGNMGVVYLCVDARLARPVAVKVLKDQAALSPADREQFLARFRHEAEAAGRLNHPDIVQIYDVGPAYIVMEFVEGRPLSQVIRSGPAPMVREVASIVTRVGDALDYAHRHGIVHRDVKPANIMLLDGAGVKVMDFGVARLESSTLTAFGTVVGSVRYMAPEQMMGHKVDGRADVFALGAVAYELLTGKAPFPGKTVTEVVARVVHGAHVPPRDVEARLPEAFDVLFATVFAPDPARRFALAGDFAQSFQDAARAIGDLVLLQDLALGAPPSRSAAPRPAEAKTAKDGVPTEVLAAAEGLVSVHSEPSGARVTLDGRAVGLTPITSLDVPFGRHVLRLEAEGHDAATLEIGLDSARPLCALSATLPRAAQAGDEPGDGVRRFAPGTTPPVRISGELPAYPEEARRRALVGSPAVEAVVTSTGDVEEVTVVASAGALLDEALVRAVWGWRFRPATRDGRPLAVRLTLRHHFAG